MSGLEKKSRERNRRPEDAIEITRYDDNAKYLIGWPGYRTARNKSGLDYIETRAELAHMYGLFIRWLATGQFRTHNPVYLLGMIGFGLLAGGIPFFFIIHEIVVHRDWNFLLLIVFSPQIPIGLLLLVNALLSIIEWEGKSITGD